MFCAKCGNSVADGAAFCASCGAPTGAPGPAAPPPVPPYQYTAPLAAYPPPAPFGPYATWADRAIGYIIDQVIVGGVMLLLFLTLGGVFGAMVGVGGDHSGFAGGMCCVLLIIFPVASLIVGIYNRVYLVSQRGYSIGQGVMKLKVIDANGQLLTQGNAAIRLLVQVGLGFIPFGGVLDLLWPLWDDRRQTLHDKAVGCFVIQNPDVR
jgi:uncharacterized RDD family membrane protein YckC